MRLTFRAWAACAFGWSLALASLGTGVRSLPAADPTAAPIVDVVLAGADELMADAEMALMLTDPTERKQWPVLKSYLEVFLIGVDPKLPTRIRVIPADKGQRLVWSIPVKDFDAFNRQNLQSILTPRVRSLGGGLYRLGSGRREDFNGYLLLAPPYAHLGETQNDVKQIAADPRVELKALLARNFTIGVEMKNKVVDAASQAKRRELFQPTRKDAIAALKKEKGETATDFEFRKKAVEIQMDEAEWFYAESEHVTGGMTIDRNKKTARVDVELTPIADSPLGKAIALLGTKPSQFANIEKSSDPILSARINHPLTEMRQKNVLAMAGLIRDGMKNRAEADTKLTADQKAGSRELADKVFSMFEATIKAGLGDGFVDVHKAPGGKDVLLGAFRAADGTKIDEIANLLPKAGAGSNVKLGEATESDVKIDSVEFSRDQHPHWNDLVGADKAYLGGAKDSVWATAGEGALEALKAAIKKSKQPPAAGAEKAPWAELLMRLKPWVEHFTAQLPVKKGEGAYRKMVLSAFEPGDDQLLIRMTRPDKSVVGEVQMQTGFVRFAGKAAASFSKENLDTAPANKK